MSGDSETLLAVWPRTRATAISRTLARIRYAHSDRVELRGWRREILPVNLTLSQHDCRPAMAAVCAQLYILQTRNHLLALFFEFGQLAAFSGNDLSGRLANKSRIVQEAAGAFKLSLDIGNLLL